MAPSRFQRGVVQNPPILGYTRRAETAGLFRPDFDWKDVRSGRRPASPAQARWGWSGPRPNRVSQCGWPWPVINSRGLLPLRSARRLRMKRRWFKKNRSRSRYEPPRWRRSVKQVRSCELRFSTSELLRGVAPWPGSPRRKARGTCIPSPLGAGSIPASMRARCWASGAAGIPLARGVRRWRGLARCRPVSHRVHRRRRARCRAGSAARRAPGGCVVHPQVRGAPAPRR